MPTHSFSARIVRWQRLYGRNDLPWQNPIEPYRVWLSEVMLQQTQVTTVLPYFARALRQWPSVQALAQAPEAEVMALWSGLGYYSRARNLHRCAQHIVADWGGEFPRRVEELAALPGVGPSTAAAIASICFGEREAILDGNVRRVVARVRAFDADLAQAQAVRQLWDEARALLPPQARGDTMRRYTQGLMDLGATVCLARAPRCDECPVRADCRAHAQDQVNRYPVKTRRASRKHETWWFLCLRRSDGAVALIQRPRSGIWGGMLAFPQFTDEANLQAAAASIRAGDLAIAAPITHSLTHRELSLVFVQARLTDAAPSEWNVKPGHPADQVQWHLPREALKLALPRPISHYLKEI